MNSDSEKGFSNAFWVQSLLKFEKNHCSPGDLSVLMNSTRTVLASLLEAFILYPRVIPDSWLIHQVNRSLES